MRVIGGRARGRPITAPQMAGLRPTSDRVREAMFDILEARGLVEDSSVLDLFAGSGALGIESLSRGAASATFVERDPRAIVAISANLRSTALSAPGALIVRAEVMTWLGGREARSREQPFDLALADPPYGFDEWALLVGLLGQAGVRTLLVEHRGLVELVAPYHIIRQYRYGGTLVTLAEASRAEWPEPTDEDRA